MSDDDDEFAPLLHRVRQARQEREKGHDLLESEANSIFAPVEEWLTRMNNALQQVGAAIDVSPTWEPDSEQKLSRTITVTSSEPLRTHRLVLTVQGTRISVDDKSYPGQRTDAVKEDIKTQVLQLLTEQR